MVTISDKKIGKLIGPVTTASYYEAIVTTASDYYPFGWQMPNRKLNAGNYSFGFNGQLQDSEWMGGQSVSFEARVYEGRLGRWLSVDPLTSKYPSISPYVGIGNNPILLIDREGKDIIIHLSNGGSLKYVPGMELPTDEFAKKVVDALNTIHSTGGGRVVVEALSNSNKNYNIKEAPIMAQTNPLDKRLTNSFFLGKDGEIDAKFEKAINTGDFQTAQSILMSTNDLLIGAWAGNWRTGWISNETGTPIDDVKMNFTLAVGHELFHAYQFESNNTSSLFLGLFLGEAEEGLPLAEAQAVGFENYLRGKLFKGTEFGTTRASYSGIQIPDFWEPTDWYDHINGYDKYDVSEFSSGGAVFDVWTKVYTLRAIAIGNSTLTTKPKKGPNSTGTNESDDGGGGGGNKRNAPSPKEEGCGDVW